jgi:hypothetical protein
MASPIAGEDPFPLRRLKPLGGEDPFPLRIASEGQVVGSWVKGRGSYRALQVGPFVRIIATGTLSYFNSTAYLVKSPLPVVPPLYGLFFFVPEVKVPAEAPFTATADFFMDEQVLQIGVYDADGRHEVPVYQAPSGII